MAQPTIKTSFASGEWAPKLRSRVDVQKYHSGAALMRNFYVDYSGGGASTRQGTRFINQGFGIGSRLIPFQPSSNLSYVLEFGQNYIAFYTNGASVLETATAITGITNANPGVVTDVAHGYVTGQRIFISSVGGMTQLNGNYYKVIVLTVDTYTLTDLNDNPINTTTFGSYTSGGVAQRVYLISSPYNRDDLFPNAATGNPGLKFVQDVTSLIITHPSYAPVVLTINSAANWTLVNAAFGPAIGTPTGLANGAGTNIGAGTWFYGYRVTAVDINGQESGPSVALILSSLLYIGTTVGTIQVTWTAVTGAVSYNVYKTLPINGSVPSSGAQYGFVGNVTTAVFNEAYPGIVADFSQTPPIIENPFIGPGVTSYNVTTAGTYTTVPGVIVAAPPSGQTATSIASLGVTVVGAITHATGNQDILTTGPDPNGSLLTFSNGIVLRITGTALIGTGGGHSFWEVTSVGASPISSGSITVGSTPTNPVSPGGCTAAGFVGFNASGGSFGISFTWGLKDILPVMDGNGYVTAPAVTFSAGAAAATAVIGPASSGNPGVPGFIQERLAFAGSLQAIQSFNFSQPGSFFNFNVSNPSQDDDAISGTIVSEELNDIRWLLPVPTGIIAGTGKGAWLINGGGGISTQVPITPTNVVAQPQSFNGTNDLRPIKINTDALYTTNKGNYVRSLNYNLYAQLFTGSDISVLSNHLFFNYYLLDWCWAEEPFKTVWAVRNDGQMLSLAYVKEQELIGWAHHDTSGSFRSVCSVVETVGTGNVVDAVYVLVERRLPDSTLVPYIERMADRYFSYGYEDSWSVDCALQTQPALSFLAPLSIFGDVSAAGNPVTFQEFAHAPFTSTMATNNWIVRTNGGIYKITSFTSAQQVDAVVVRPPPVFNYYNNQSLLIYGGFTIWTPITSVSGLTQLIGQSVVGVADGVAVGPYTVSALGTVALGLTATKVTLGLAYLPQLQTLPLDLGEPTVQGKRKKITGLTLRVADTLGLQVGKTFATVVAMKDFILGNVPTTSTGVAKVTDLVNGDGRTIIDQEWDTAGNYCIQQNLPYPATILGAMPETTVGDGK
jgi:hypothetical protein